MVVGMYWRSAGRHLVPTHGHVMLVFCLQNKKSYMASFCTDKHLQSHETPLHCMGLASGGIAVACIGAWPQHSTKHVTILYVLVQVKKVKGTFRVDPRQAFGSSFTGIPASDTVADVITGVSSQWSGMGSDTGIASGTVFRPVQSTFDHHHQQSAFLHHDCKCRPSVIGMDALIALILSRSYTMLNSSVTDPTLTQSIIPSKTKAKARPFSP